MFEIDKKNLILRNKLTKNNQELITINITGDFAPIIREACDLMLKKIILKIYYHFFKKET